MLEYTRINSIFPCRAGMEVLWARRAGGRAHRQPCPFHYNRKPVPKWLGQHVLRVLRLMTSSSLPQFFPIPLPRSHLHYLSAACIHDMGKCMVRCLTIGTRGLTRSPNHFLHIKLNLFYIFLYKFFVVYEEEPNQKNYNIIFLNLIIIIKKTDQNSIKVSINI
jgi:hypothetical protein